MEPAMKAAFQNEGAYSAKELIQGTSRSQFQDALSTSLNQQISARNVHVLLALIRNIAVKDNSGNDATSGLLATIQQANIEKEKDLDHPAEDNYRNREGGVGAGHQAGGRQPARRSPPRRR